MKRQTQRCKGLLLTEFIASSRNLTLGVTLRFTAAFYFHCDKQTVPVPNYNFFNVASDLQVGVSLQKGQFNWNNSRSEK
jgi:hypothetical protein